jgi:ABC-type multidrug transport system ATPase subunit
MKIKLIDAGKRFNREWIFRHADLEFVSGTAYAFTGPNGSGKSTLLQTIGCLLEPSEGKISFWKNEVELPVEKGFQYISFCAPYLDVVEEMTLFEFLQFHKEFKPFIAGFDTVAIIESIGLQTSGNKQIRNFSSGMKQRVKLAQAIFSDTPVILLDEPCTNLDAAGIELYQQLIKQHCLDRLVIVSSNDKIEYGFCEVEIEISRFK